VTPAGWRQFIAPEPSGEESATEPVAHGRRDIWIIVLSATVIVAAVSAIFGYHALFVPINTLAAGWPDTLLESLSDLGDSLVALTALLFFVPKRPHTVRLGIVAAGLSTLLSNGLKAAFALPRPAAVLASNRFHLVGPGLLTRGFPSGHTVTAFVAAAVFGWFEPRPVIRWCWLALAAAIGWSRVAVGAHWPLDVLAGTAVGGVSVLLAAPLAQRWHGGIAPAGCALLATILCGCAIALLFYTPLYPLGIPLVRAIAVAALATWLWVLARAHQKQADIRP